MRGRTIAVHGQGNGQFCVGDLKQTAPCNPAVGEEQPAQCQKAPSVDCQLNQWAAWSACSKDCGGGSHTRTRDIAVYPANMGQPCNETLAEVAACNRAPCQQACSPQDCRWSDWGIWGACDKCGGQMKRFRHVIQEAACGGDTCEPQAAEETTGCTRKCHEPVYCQWGTWGSWSSCSATCGAAEKSRTRNLMLTAKPDMPASVGLSNLTSVDDSTGLDEMALGFHLQAVQERSRSVHTRRLQELSVAFTCGGVSLVACLAVFRFFSRSARGSLSSQEESHWQASASL